MTIIDKQTEIINTENKFLNPIWLWGQNNTRYKPYMGLEGQPCPKDSESI